MITDDPGTPGNNHWEINVAWTDQEAPGSTLIGLPLLDANYGVGDRIQINYQGSWNILRQPGASTEDGMSESQFAVKWRFYDAGDSGYQMSMYPRYTFPNPDSDSDKRGTEDPHPSFLLPFEVERNLGFLSVNVDFGHMFSGFAGDRGWTGGICVGREVTKGWELDAEVHATASEDLGRSEVTLNLGTRYDFNEHTTLLVAVGKDTSNSLGPRISVLTYLGIQVRL